MSLLEGLDESEKSINHGWDSSGRFGMDSSLTSQDRSQNIYHHLINQNNTGLVPDIVHGEEVVLPNGPGQTYQDDFNQGHQAQTPQRLHVNPAVTSISMNQTQQQVGSHIQGNKGHAQGQHNVPTQQFQQRQNETPQMQHSCKTPQHVTSGQGRNILYTVIQQGEKAVENQFNSLVPSHPNSQNVKFQQVQHNFQGEHSNNQLDGTLKGSEEEILDQKIKLQEQKIAENQKMIAMYTQLGFQTMGNTDHSPQVHTSISTAPSPGNSNLGVKNVNILNNSQSHQKLMDNKMTESNFTTNQAKTIIHMNPVGTLNKTTLMTLPGQRSSAMLSQDISPQVMSIPQSKLVDGSPKILNSPVQVSSVSSNQLPGTSCSSLVMSKINKHNVVLEGGGQFEEGQAYVIRDKHGRSQTMIWRNGDFVPLQNSNKIIQHHIVDSSQRGRGSRGRGGRGRGRGQGHGNTTGSAPANARGSPRMRQPGQRFVRPNIPALGPSNVYRHDLQHQITHQGNRHVHPSPKQTLIIQKPASQGLPQQQSPNLPVSVVTGGQQQPILTSVTLKNLMPPAQGSQKTASCSGTNLARDQLGQEEIEEPEKDVNQTVNTSTPCASQGEKTEVQDPPRIPSDPNAVAVCQFCGYISEDKVQCESCKRKFTSATRYQIKGTGVQISFDDSGQKKRKMDKSCLSNITLINKKAFYGKKMDEQNQLYSQIIQNANGNTLTVAISRNPRIITRGVARSRGRGRGRGRGVYVPETITLSSDDEEGEPKEKTPADMDNPSEGRSPSQVKPSSQEFPESPLIPNIPISSSKVVNRSRRDKMEDEAGLSRKDRENSCSPINVLLTARSITVGTFRGIPLEPIVLCKNGLRFFVEGNQKSHRFSIFPQEIQQCLAHFSERTTSYLFFLVSQGCGVRTRKDLGIKEHKDPTTPPPEPYYDPFGADLTHQMITVIMSKLETTVIVEFQKYMDMFKSWGKQGDEAFFMELTEQEADEVRKQSLSKMVFPQVGVGTMVQDHEYSQQDEERSRSPSPPRIGFVGHVVKLLTYPPPPEKRGISITNEDLFCLQQGEFLNDVIIDFYLKYLHKEKMSEQDRERTHIFSSFFYKRLTQRIRGAAIDDDPNLPLQEKRHARVKTWTRHVDLFKKDFIVIPINEHAHWFLAIICYPWLMEAVENKYIPNRSVPPCLDSFNIPTPPQPTDDNTDDMESEEAENPIHEQKPDVPVTPVSESTNAEPEGSDVNSQVKVDQPATSETTCQETDCENKPESMEIDQNGDSVGDGTQTVMETMDTGESTKGDENENTEETKQEMKDAETSPETPVSKSALYQKVQNIRPIRGQPLQDGDDKPEDVLTGVKQPCILIFDSLSGPSRSRIVTVLKEYLQVEWHVKKEAEAERPLNKAAIRGCVPKVPQQNNFSDCGVFMLQYVESFFEDPIQDFTTPMKGLHDWFTTQKIEGKREELKDLIISLKEKYESKCDGIENT